MRRALTWLAGAALVVTAGVVAVITPDADAQDGPFLTHGTAGHPVTSRNLTVVVEDAAFADRVTVEDDDWEADGNWLVVSLSAAARQSEVDAALRLVKLVVDGREFVASERPATSIVGDDLRVGIQTSGMVAFELPADVTAGEAELRVSMPYSTPHLDDVIVVPLDLTDAGRESTIDIVEPTTGEAP
ncbi:hypothetical protein [Microbacterium hydrocarbonoxydans]|jgi:hypothetical protein|uniref:hypothetical protein n=1 Tax=Microbacterium hydrocarbonoxydans TaxID=273678 RepID=UPI003D999FDF